jgi:hypothetical protein
MIVPEPQLKKEVKYNLLLHSSISIMNGATELIEKEAIFSEA